MTHVHGVMRVFNFAQTKIHSSFILNFFFNLSICYTLLLQSNAKIFALEEEMVHLRRKAHVEQINEVRPCCVRTFYALNSVRIIYYVDKRY